MIKKFIECSCCEWMEHGTVMFAAGASSNLPESLCPMTSLCEHQELCYTHFCNKVHMYICDFTMDLKLVQRANIKFCIKLGKSATETLEMLQQAYCKWNSGFSSWFQQLFPLYGNLTILMHNVCSISWLFSRAVITNGCPGFLMFTSDVLPLLKHECNSEPLVWLIASLT